MASASIGWELAQDHELVARVKAGENDFFEEIVRRYQRQIGNFIYRMIGDYETALDLTQEVFIKIYASLDRYKFEYKFSTWIFKIASNTAIDHLRKQTVLIRSLSQTTADMEEVELQLPDRAASPEQALAKRERREQIEWVIAKLPPHYRELIVLRHVNDLSYDEIAEVTGLPLGTVKNRIFRAREAMRKQLQRLGIEGLD